MPSADIRRIISLYTGKPVDEIKISLASDGGFCSALLINVEPGSLLHRLYGTRLDTKSVGLTLSEVVAMGIALSSWR